MKKLPTVGEDEVQDHQRKLKVHKSMGPDEVHACMGLEETDR